MRISRPLVVSSLALLLVGAGCAATPGEPATPSANRPVSPTGTPLVNAPVTNAPPTTPPGQEIRALPAASGVDATWKTYTNAALGFSFQTPTKGRYAPTWEVRFLAEDDADVEDGCYITANNQAVEADRLRVGDAVFCVTATNEGAAGSVYVTRHVVTKKGARYILMAFTKRAVNVGMLDCATPPASGLSVSSEACVPFDMAAYDAQIEQIISTFAFSE